MKRLLAGLIVSVLFAADVLAEGMPVIRLAQAAKFDPAYLLVKEKNDEVLKILRSGISPETQARIVSTVQDAFDFERMTALAVGKPWLQASPDQKLKLQEAFKTLLTSTYASAMIKFKDAEIFVDPKVEIKGSQTIVRTSVTNISSPTGIDYTLYGNKIFNVSVSGASLITVYRSNFGEVISKGGIDALISDLQNRVRR